MCRKAKFRRIPLDHIDKAEGGIARQGAMHLVPQVAGLGSHICIDPLEQLEKLILPPNGNSKQLINVTAIVTSFKSGIELIAHVCN